MDETERQGVHWSVGRRGQAVTQILSPRHERERENVCETAGVIAGLADDGGTLILTRTAAVVKGREKMASRHAPSATQNRACELSKKLRGSRIRREEGMSAEMGSQVRCVGSADRTRRGARGD